MTSRGQGTTHELGTLRTDGEGYLDTAFDVSNLSLRPGRYAVEVSIDGHLAGSSLATLLASDRRVPVVRSDVDLTYLQTDFQSLSAMLSLLREPASDKVALAGMVPIYQAIRGDADFWLDSIDELAPGIDASGDAVPLAIYINRSDHRAEAFDIADWMIPGVTRYHRGAWPLALDMSDEGWIGADAVQRTRQELLLAGSTEEELRVNADEADFLLH